MSVYLRAKFQVSSLILTSFRQGGRGWGNFTNPPQNEPLKGPPTLGLRLNNYIAVLKVTFRT